MHLDRIDYEMYITISLINEHYVIVCVCVTFIRKLRNQIDYDDLFYCIIIRIT